MASSALIPSHHQTLLPKSKGREINHEVPDGPNPEGNG